MVDYKVFISSAGTGSRLKAHTSFRNKGLMTLGVKPAISLIIEKFSPNIPIVIAVGYQKDSLTEVLNEAHPDRNIEFVTVDHYEGPGSGLGYSMKCCEHLLQCPFVFVPNDTLITNEAIDLNPNSFGNWVGLFDNNTGHLDPAHYRCAETVDTEVVGILPKGLATGNIYIGLCGIKDYQDFWIAMNSSDNAILEGESFGLNKLISKSAIYFENWDDTGNINGIEKIFSKFRSSEHNILPKKEEALWIFKDRCIKYHKDQQFIKDRLTRTKFLPEKLIPKMLNSGNYFFSYEFVEGSLLSRHSDYDVFGSFLNQMHLHLWTQKAPPPQDALLVQEAFYRKKTIQRVQAYLDRFDQTDVVTTINGKSVDPVFDVLTNFDWSSFYAGAVWANFHGDLHGENVVVQNNQEFKLLDWRQNFGPDNYEVGDIYYDFGKILHGLIVRHSMVSQSRYSLDYQSTSSVSIDIENTQAFFELQSFFCEWIEAKGYDLERVKAVTALIFLNIAALHHYPYAKFLFLLGQQHINRPSKFV